MNAKLLKLQENAKNFFKKSNKKTTALVSGISLSGISAIVASADPGDNNVLAGISTLDISPLIDTVTAIVTLVLPAIITFAAIRKGLGFLLGAIRGL